MSKAGKEAAALFLQADMAAPELSPIASGVVALFTARAPGKETENEDAAALLPAGNDSCILVVADGMRNNFV